MKVKIIKPDATLFEGEASLLQLPGTGGQFEIMKDHAPIVSALSAGNIRLVTPDGEKIIAVKAGVVRGQQNDILVLAQ